MSSGATLWPGIRRFVLGPLVAIAFGWLALIGYAPDVRTDDGWASGFLAFVPAGPDELARKGQLSVNMGAVDAAERFFGGALEIEPLNSLSVRGLWTVWRNQQNSDRARRARDVLAHLGWRNEDAQIDLLNDALDRDDYVSAVRHADALLRTARISQSLFDVLTELEATADGRRELIHALSDRPAWSRTYFGSLGRLDQPQLARRLAIAQQLVGGQHGYAPADVAPLVGRAFASGLTEQARILWASAVGDREGGSVILFDRDFARFAAHLRAGKGAADPFGWKAEAGESFDVAPGAVSGDVGVTVRWAGRGNPILLSQVVKAVPGARTVVLRGSGLTGAGGAPLIEVGLRCGRAQPVILPIRSQGDMLLRTDPVDLARVGCAYPHLELAISPLAGGGPAEFSIDSIVATSARSTQKQTRAATANRSHPQERADYMNAPPPIGWTGVRNSNAG